MDLILTISGTILTVAILICLVRMVKGPTVLDRILAFDAITICIVGLMVLLSVRWKTPYFVELIIVYSLLGFLGSVAFLFYLQRTMPDPEAKPKPDDDGRGAIER
jgi:multicomponent Na+:H+ antiporter subunit F